MVLIGFVHVCSDPYVHRNYTSWDRLNVSEKFYHELSMVQPTIPRSHRIKRVRSELNQSLKTKMYRVPGPNHGVYCSLTGKLCEELEVIAAHDVPNCIRFS